MVEDETKRRPEPLYRLNQKNLMRLKNPASVVHVKNKNREKHSSTLGLAPFPTGDIGGA